MGKAYDLQSEVFIERLKLVDVSVDIVKAQSKQTAELTLQTRYQQTIFLATSADADSK